MFQQSVFVVLLVGVGLASSLAFSPYPIGDQVAYSYNAFRSMPITKAAALAAGWKFSDTCSAVHGFTATLSAGGATESEPVTLHFNGAGQLSGIGMTIYGTGVSPLLVERGFLTPISNSVHRIAVVFRTHDLCLTTPSPNPLGNVLLVNPDTINFSLPVIEREAQSAAWTQGSCFADMGTHYFYDLVSAPKMSWVSANMLPIVPMYHDGFINAIFFASNVVQQSLFSSQMWDRVALPDVLMCKNWCDSNCTFSDTNFWSTGHFFFRNYSQVTCPGGCSIGCCPGSDSEY